MSRVYDLDWGKFAKQHLGLINELLNERGISRDRILDLACGTGTLAVGLPSQGHSVHGVDVSPEMINIARMKSVRLPTASFEIQNMTKFRVEGPFDLVTCTFDSVNYLLDIDDIREVFYRISGTLRPSGIFIFDSNTSQLYLNVQQGAQQRNLGEESFLQKFSYELIKKEATITFEFSDGAIEVHQQRPYDLAELEPILIDVGLSVVQAFSGFDKKPYNADSERLICVAEKEP